MSNFAPSGMPTSPYDPRISPFSVNPYFNPNSFLYPYRNNVPVPQPPATRPTYHPNLHENPATGSPPEEFVYGGWMY